MSFLLNYERPFVYLLIKDNKRMKGVYVPDTVVIQSPDDIDWFYTSSQNCITKKPSIASNILTIQNFFIKRSETPSMLEDSKL